MTLTNIDSNIIKNFVDNSKNTCKITKLNISIPNNYEQVQLALTRAYSDTKRVCRGINNSIYICGSFVGQPVLQTIFEEINKFISNLKYIKTQREFDNKHDKLCLSLSCAYQDIYQNECYKVTYGIAQKILNMTLKYLYIEDTINRKNILPSGIEDYFHCPIDGVLLCNLKHADAHYFYNINIVGKNRGVFCTTPWYKFSQTDYLCFLYLLRNKLLNGVKQLEVDFHLWNSTCGKLSQATVNFFNLKNDTPPSLIGVLFK